MTLRPSILITALACVLIGAVAFDVWSVRRSHDAKAAQRTAGHRLDEAKQQDMTAERKLMRERGVRPALAKRQIVAQTFVAGARDSKALTVPNCVTWWNEAPPQSGYTSFKRTQANVRIADGNCRVVVADFSQDYANPCTRLSTGVFQCQSRMLPRISELEPGDRNFNAHMIDGDGRLELDA